MATARLKSDVHSAVILCLAGHGRAKAEWVHLAKVDRKSMGEVRERLVRRMCRYVDVRCLNDTHGGGKVGTSYLSCAVVSGLKPRAAFVGGYVRNQRARGIGISTIKESATCFWAAQDSQSQ